MSTSLDLVTFIPGIGPTALFTPGAGTPSAFTGPHNGVTNGTGPGTASNNVAELYNRILLQIAGTISYAGLTIDNTNWAQLPSAIRSIAYAQAVVSAQALGFGGSTQAWSDKTSSRVAATTYYNTGTRGMGVSIQPTAAASATGAIFVNSIQVASYNAGTAANGQVAQLFAIVPVGAPYYYSGTAAIASWKEF